MLRGGAVLLTFLLMVFPALSKEVNPFDDHLDVDLLLSEAPQIEYKKGGIAVPRADSVNHWLIIKVGFTVKKSNAVPVVSAGRKPNVFLNGVVDDVELGIRVLLNTPLKLDNKNIHCLFSGRTEFYSLRRDGKKHQAVMFVPAKLLDRCNVGGDGGVRQASKKDFVAEAVISKAGKVLARGYCNISGKKAFENMMLEVPENLRIVGGVFPRSRTPWAWVDFDRFDLEKEPLPHSGAVTDVSSAGSGVGK